MESYYEVTISKDGQYLFSTAERAIRSTDKQKMESIITLFKEKFPEAEGYKVSCTLWKCSGHPIL